MHLHRMLTPMMTYITLVTFNICNSMHTWVSGYDGLLVASCYHRVAVAVKGDSNIHSKNNCLRITKSYTMQ